MKIRFLSLLLLSFMSAYAMENRGNETYQRSAAEPKSRFNLPRPEGLEQQGLPRSYRPRSSHRRTWVTLYNRIQEEKDSNDDQFRFNTQDLPDEWRE